MRRDLRNSHHLATISFDGRFWDAYLELAEAPAPGHPARGRIAFSAADAGEADPVRTTTIFIEDTPQEVVIRAREFKTHQLVALLRSAIPPDAIPPHAAPPAEPAPPPQAGPSPAPPPEEEGGPVRDQGDPAGEV
jgi:hypothetical protein